jgi:hypothetical protein
MIERRRESVRFGKRTARRDMSPPHDPYLRSDQTVPRIPPPGLVAADEPTILGFPADDEPEGDTVSGGYEPWVEQRSAVTEAPAEPQMQVVTVQRADPAAGIAFVLAGLAAIASLWLPWGPSQGHTGISLVWQGVAVADAGAADLGRSPLWQPLAIVLAGALFLLIAVFLFLPARTHRVVGVLALLVSIGAATAVLFWVARAGWRPALLGPGVWVAVAVPALGILGALKAMLTTPRGRLGRRSAVRT